MSGPGVSSRPFCKRRGPRTEGPLRQGSFYASTTTVTIRVLWASAELRCASPRERLGNLRLATQDNVDWMGREPENYPVGLAANRVEPSRRSGGEPIGPISRVWNNQ